MCSTAKPRTFLISFALLLIMIGALAQSGGGFDLSWWTVDSGGGQCTEGDYNLIGCIGQPDAGDMSGGSFSLQGGFLAVPAAKPKNSVKTWMEYDAE